MPLFGAVNVNAIRYSIKQEINQRLRNGKKLEVSKKTNNFSVLYLSGGE